MTEFGNAKLNLRIHLIIVYRYVMFHDDWPSSLREDSNNKSSSNWVIKELRFASSNGIITILYCIMIN